MVMGRGGGGGEKRCIVGLWMGIRMEMGEGEGSVAAGLGLA